MPPRIWHWDLQVNIFVVLYFLKVSQHLQCAGQRVTCYPAVPFFITDEKDLATCVTGLYASGRAHRPCNLCDLDFGNNADITQKGPQRQITQLKQVVALALTFVHNYTFNVFFQLLAQYSGPGKKMPKSISKQYSLHPEPNPIFDLPGFNACKNPSCRMHACDHGVFKRLLDMVLELVGKQRAEIKRTFDER